MFILPIKERILNLSVIDCSENEFISFFMENPILMGKTQFWLPKKGWEVDRNEDQEPKEDKSMFFS